MGKNRTRESLIREITNLIVHEILRKNTNRPESKRFLESEAIEYRGRVEKTLDKYNWNNEDKEYIKEKSLKFIKEKLAVKYPDVKYSEQEAVEKLRKMISSIFP